jgi:hypothetical protein
MIGTGLRAGSQKVGEELVRHTGGCSRNLEGSGQDGGTCTETTTGGCDVRVGASTVGAKGILVSRAGTIRVATRVGLQLETGEAGQDVQVRIGERASVRANRTALPQVGVDALGAEASKLAQSCEEVALILSGFKSTFVIDFAARLQALVEERNHAQELSWSLSNIAKSAVDRDDSRGEQQQGGGCENGTHHDGSDGGQLACLWNKLNA